MDMNELATKAGSAWGRTKAWFKKNPAAGIALAVAVVLIAVAVVR